MKTIQSVMDQLKLKQCKAVIAILVTAKLKIMKKWRVVDAGFVYPSELKIQRHKWETLCRFA